MRPWPPGAQCDLIEFLSIMADDEEPHADHELWRVSKNARERRCTVVYLPSGIDLRLMEGADFRRTQLCRDVPAVEALAHGWRSKLFDNGWALP